MITAAKAAWTFLAGNWSWAVPWGLVAAIGVYGGLQHMQVLTLETNAADFDARAEKAVNDAKAADAIKTAQLEQAHAAQAKALQENANAQQVSIAAAAKSDVCLHSAAGAAFLGGLRAPDAGPGVGQPRPAARAGAAVSAGTGP